MQDPIVDEIRRIRREHAERFQFDLDAIFEDLRDQQRRSQRKIVSRPPRPAKAVMRGK
jgi:hypothetical protein